MSNPIHKVVLDRYAAPALGFVEAASGCCTTCNGDCGCNGDTCCTDGDTCSGSGCCGF